MNTQRILTNETEALCLMPTGDFFELAESSGTPEGAGGRFAGPEPGLAWGDRGDSSLPFPFLALGDEDDDEDAEDEEDNFDDMDDDFDDDDDDFDDDFDDDDDDDDFDDDENDDYDYDDDVDYDDDFEE